VDHLQGRLQLRKPAAATSAWYQLNLCTEINPEHPRPIKSPCATWARSSLPNLYRGRQAGHGPKLRATIQDRRAHAEINVHRINYYSVPQAKNSHTSSTAGRLGIMGFQDALYLQHIAYGSMRRELCRPVPMEGVSYYAIQGLL